MRVKYIFSSRKTKRARDNKNMRKQRGKFPDILKKVIEMSDVIIEVLDARFFYETRNLEIEELIKKQDKKIIYVLNKSDLLSGKGKTEKSKLKEIFPYVFVSCKQRKGIRDLRNKIKAEANKIKKPAEKDLGKIHVGIIGYPNTGKSSLINLLIGKSKAGTGAEAGFTKGIQKLKLTPEILLLDSPGVIPEKEYSTAQKERTLKYAKLGAKAYSQVRDPEMAVAELMREYPEAIEKFYKITAEKNPEELIEKLGRKKGFLKKGEEVNFDKTARLILKDWQEGRIHLTEAN